MGCAPFDRLPGPLRRGHGDGIDGAQDFEEVPATAGPLMPNEPTGSGSFRILAGAIWSAPPTTALWLSAEPVARADVPFQLSVAKRAKAAALPPHSKSPTVSGPSYRTPQNEPLPASLKP